MTDTRKLTVGKAHGYPHPVVIREDAAYACVKVCDVFHDSDHTARETAEEMVKRWNCHNQLVEACMAAKVMLGCVLDDQNQFGQPCASPKWIKTRETVKAAIDAATQKERQA